MDITQDLRRFYPVDFYEARDRFQRRLEKYHLAYPVIEMGEEPIAVPEGAPGNDLTIEWVHIAAGKEPQNLVVLTAGEHGMEGFVGAAMIEYFTDVFLPQLDLQKTGLLIIPCLNPWGMCYRRRTNAFNVDLNRNFIYDENFFGERSSHFNPDYASIQNLINPTSRIGTLGAYERSELLFLLRVFWNILTAGQSTIRVATLLGQYRYHEGIYYGGSGIQLETRTVMDLYRRFFARYERIVHLDMHTGYGPSNLMSIVNSSLENRSSEALCEVFQYPMIVKSNPSEFYVMQGDMIDFEYNLIYNEFPEKTLYATTFEFGTLGDSLSARLTSMLSMILENQVYHHGSDDGRVREAVMRRFTELYYPDDETWREKALRDAHQAFNGILKAEGLIR